MDVRVLGRFEPPELTEGAIIAGIRPLLPPCCQRERISVRIPDARTVVHPDNLQWHQDGGGRLGTVRHMVVWATETPTEVCGEDGAIQHADPYDLLWFNNDAVFHRQPKDTAEGSRWFVSVRCSG